MTGPDVDAITAANDAHADALRESEQLFHAVWQASSDAMALSDADGTVIRANPAYLELYGFADEEVVGRNFAIIFPENVRDNANRLYQEAFKSSQVLAPFETVIQRKDGTERVVESKADFIEHNGLRVAMLSTVRDITERVRQAAALRASEELFRQTFEGAPIGMALIGLDFKPIRLNSALCDMLGYNMAELLNMRIEDITHPDDIEADLNLAQRLLNAEIPSYILEKRYYTKSGAVVWAQLSVALVRDKDGNMLYALSMIEDVTDRKRIEEERTHILAQERQARTIAERAVRAQEELLSLVAHDLRNPLTVIKGEVQLLQRRIAGGSPPDPVHLEAQLSRLMSATTRMEHFTKDLLISEQLQAGEHLPITLERTDLVALARRVTEMHQHQTKRHQLVLETKHPELIGYWDPSKIEQVLDNLISNAVKYSPAGGRVTIGVGCQDSGAPVTALGNREAANELDDGIDRIVAKVTVRDEGMGIPARDLPYVFEWYRRGSNVQANVQGTGVGLAGARQIVEQHGGNITVESREGVGSTFTVLLPLKVTADRLQDR